MVLKGKDRSKIETFDFISTHLDFKRNEIMGQQKLHMNLSANGNTLIKKVFDLYTYSRSDRELPILSLLQHYAAPTALMDWTYNNNVAFDFATDGLKKKEEPKTNIDDYFSVYRINKRKCKNELLNH